MNMKIIPEGYLENARGDLIPVGKIKPIDLVRSELVLSLCQRAYLQSAALAKFKLDVFGELSAFVELSNAEYDVHVGGSKGNLTLTTFDGAYKVTRQIADTIVFGPSLLAAKELIDQCVQAWAQGANDNIRVLVNHAFQTDKTGKINTDRVLALRQLEIKDATWSQAMNAIADSIQTAGSKPYVRFYKRNDATGEYDPITLSVAAA